MGVALKPRGLPASHRIGQRGIEIIARLYLIAKQA